MIIPLDDKLRIRGTTECWQLEQLKKIKDANEWRAFKYFTTVDNALHETAQRELRVYPTQTLAEASDTCNRVTHKYSKIFGDGGRLPLRSAS